MTTRLQFQGPRPNVSVGPTAARTTAQPARPFQQLIRAGTNAIVATAEQAATRLTGGPILAAALRPGGVEAGDPRAPEGARSALTTTGSVGMPTLRDASGLGATSVETGAVDGSSGALGDAATAGAAGANTIGGALAQNADDYMFYLELQERISKENRRFTALSNVLKARHETVKNAIGNIR